MTTIIKIEITAEDDTHAADVLTRLAIKMTFLAHGAGFGVDVVHIDKPHGEGRAVVTRA